MVLYFKNIKYLALDIDDINDVHTIEKTNIDACISDTIN